jgi:hypothetical protein
MAHDEPGFAYADYFAAAAGAVATFVPEVDVGGGGEEGLHLYGLQPHHQQPGVEMYGARGHMPPAAMMAAHGGKAALGLDVASPVVGGHFGDDHLRQALQAPLSLSLHDDGTADAAPLALHHHHHHLGGVPQAQQHQPPGAWPQPQQQGAWHLRGSRFLRPTQQLLQEFCTLPVDTVTSTPAKPASVEDGVGSSSSAAAPSQQIIQAMDAAELQRLKAKLYAMLQEVLLFLRSLISHQSSCLKPSLRQQQQARTGHMSSSRIRSPCYLSLEI